MITADQLRQVVRLALDEDLTFLAAAIAYYAFVSLFPALLLAVAIASTIGGTRPADLVVSGAGEFLTPSGAELVRETIGAGVGRGGATVVGVIGLLWSTLKVFRGLDTAVARLYGTPRRGLVPRLRDVAVVFVSVGLGIGVMTGIGAILAVISSPGAWLVTLALLLVGLVVVFLPLYVVFPDDGTIREALPGTLLAAVGWVLLQGLFQAYTDIAVRFEIYGVIGGILLLVTWFYLASILLLTGVAVNVVLADRVNRQVQGRGA